MAAKNKPESTTAKITRGESVSQHSKIPLVFISHDTRDAEIAEAFSKLLSSVSAGVLKSFRSSDRKGTQGIEYGVEWFPEIMKKLDEASDIVCLLTRHSVDRPWILYEAGVAKGKLNTMVLGIAVGIPLQEASNGPFAQFQNCADDEESLTKLVLQLVRRIPNSEPVEEVINEQVVAFKLKLTALINNQPQIIKSADEPKEDTSTAKLFEEVKIMFQDLPARIERRVNPEGLNRRKRKFHPVLFDQILHFGLKTKNGNLGFLMIISLLRDDFPWLYEIGVDTYHTLKSTKSKIEKQKALDNFEDAFEMLDHPVFFEMYGRSEDLFINFKELRNIFHHYFARFLHQEAIEK